MKSMVIIYDSEDWDKPIPLADAPETRQSFEDFYEFAHTRGIDVFRAYVGWFNREENHFEKAWTFHNGSWTKIEETIVPDAIFDKLPGSRSYGLFDLKSAMSLKTPIFNPPIFRAALDNKASQYLAFRKFMPVSALAGNTRELSDIVERMAGNKVVLKQVYGSGGKQVEIRERADAAKTALVFPLLVQEFVMTSGVPGVSASGEVADLRLVYIGDELIYALSRRAAKGSLFTNFHRGADALPVPIQKIPESCLAAATEISGELTSVFQSINYSLDFMFTKEGVPLFIEMNTTPGFDLLRIVGNHDIKEYYFDTLLNSFFADTKIIRKER